MSIWLSISRERETEKDIGHNFIFSLQSETFDFAICFCFVLLLSDKEVKKDTFVCEKVLANLSKYLIQDSGFHKAVAKF